jgi:pimeloyl-ACP methyl ester carboxylesterase
MRRWVAGLVVLGLVAVTVGIAGTILSLRQGLFLAPARPGITASADAQATQPPDPALADFYDQRLDWKPCAADDGDDCASLEVPLDYADPGGETIELAVLRHPAAVSRDRLGSLVVNPGGPGVPGTSYAAGATTNFGQEIVDRFDVVGFDPRGTGGSSPVDCLTDDQLDAYVAGDPDPDTLAEVRRFMASVREFDRGCVERSGDLAAHVSTIEAARDMDVLRAALGESTMVYFGASYGTELGSTYADLFPDKVGRMVLDGAIDPKLTSRQDSLQQAEGFQTALDAYIQNCLDSTDSCFLGDSLEEGRQRIADFMAQVDSQPLPLSDGRELTAGNAFYGIVLPLYRESFWFLLSNALRAAFDGDGDQLMALSDAYTSRGPSGYTDNSLEAFSVISCLDDPWSIPARKVPAQLPAFEKASPTFGDIFAWGLVGCRGFPYRSSEEPQVPHAVGAPPIVVIGTTRDPATPMAWAESLASELDSGVLIRRDGDGHTGYHAGNQCVDTAVEDYLVTGAVPNNGLSC